MKPPYKAQCLCGAIEFRVTEPPLTFYACHCTDCQRRSGSAFGLSMWFRLRAIEVTKGEPSLHVSKSSAGTRDRHASICADCFVRLWSEPQRHPGLAVLRPGVLEDVSWFKPVAHLWTRSAQPWVAFPDGAVRFETQPASFQELLDLWQQRSAGVL